MAKAKEWSEILLQLLQWLFAGLFFLVPLVLWPKTSELFEFNKMLLVYAFTLGIGGTYLARAVLEKKLTLTRTPLDLALLLFLASQVLATVFSINLHTSLWGYYSRFHGGLVSTVAYVSLFYMFTSWLNSLAQPQRKRALQLMLYAILSSAILVAAYGVLERLGIDKHLWVQDVQSRVFSTLGQPNWLSAYLAALLPLPIYLAVQTKDRKRRLIWTLAAVLFFATILFTRSRSGIATTFIILALIAGWEVMTSIKSQSTKKSPWLILGALFLALIWVGSPWTPSPQDLSSRFDLGGPLWPEIEPYIGRVGLTSQIKPLEIERLPKEDQLTLTKRAAGERVGGSDSLEIRQVVWEGAVELFKRRPILGTGVETFAYSYYWTRPVRHNLLSEWDFLYNKAHNEYLNFLATTGIVGFASYAFLILSMLHVYLKGVKQKNPLALPVLFGFISILITNYFGFSVVVVALFFFLFPGLVLAGSEDTLTTVSLGQGWQLTKKELKHGGGDLTPTQWVAIMALIAGVLLGMYQLYKFWWSDQLYNQGRLYHGAGYVGQALTLLEKATDMNPQEPVFHAQLAETNADIALAIFQQAQAATASAVMLEQTASQRESYMTAAVTEANLAVSQNPWHINFLKSKAKVELTLALIDPQYFDSALQTLIRANELAPTDPKIVYNIGLIYEQLGKIDQARQAYEKTLELKPDYEAVRADLARVNLL